MKIQGEFDTIVESVQVDRVGFVSASIKRMYRFEDLQGSIPGPQSLTAYGGVHTRTTVETDAGVTTVRWLYEGIYQNASTAVYLYEFQGSMESVPIQAHPQYRSWLNVYGNEDTNGNWRPFHSMPTTGGSGLPGSGGDTAQGGKNPLLGVEAFLSIGGVWTMRYGIRTVPSSALSGVGTITSSVPGTPPAIPANRNWLKGSPTITWRGNAWDVTEQYLLSGMGGWSRLVYDGSTSMQ